MKLYSGDLSPYSAKVRMQIYAKGITDIDIELPPGFRTGEFYKTSALARIPVLDIDGDLIPESEVISEFLEETYPDISLLGHTPRERARVRTVSRLADIYLLNNMFLCLPQGQKSTRNDGIVALLTGQVKRGIKALEAYLSDGEFAVGDGLSLADCTLVPALFLIENVIGTFDVENPIPGTPKVATYWAGIQKNEHAARVLVELYRGLDERRALMRAMATKAGA